jgi:hypothetical protein
MVVHPIVHPFIDCVFMGVLEVFLKMDWDLIFYFRERIGWGQVDFEKWNRVDFDS